MWACLVGDNSLCICLCIIVVLWLQSVHDVGVWWGLLLVDFAQLSWSSSSCTCVCCLLRCVPVVSSAAWLKYALSGERIQQYHVCWRPTATLGGSSFLSKQIYTQWEHLVCMISSCCIFDPTKVKFALLIKYSITILMFLYKITCFDLSVRFNNSLYNFV